MAIHLPRGHIELFTYFIKNNIPCVYAKYGDGEFLAAIGGRGENTNCDNTPYTGKLQNEINESFTYITQQPNAYVGQYHGETFEYWNNLIKTHIKWITYHLFIFYGPEEFTPAKKALYRAIKYTSQQKIYICNQRMVNKSKTLLNIDDHIIVDESNWFENEFDSIIDTCYKTVREPNNIIIMTSAGMGAKPLIAHLHKLLPNATFLDIGSALDLICTGNPTRAFHNVSHTYNQLVEFFNDV